MNFWEFILFLSIGFVITIGKKQSDKISVAFPDFLYAISQNPNAISDLSNYDGNDINNNQENKQNQYLCKLHSNRYNYLDDKSLLESNDNLYYLLNDFDAKELDRRNEQELVVLENEIKNKNEKRGSVGNGCDCKIKNDIIDLGYAHFPRYLFNAVCQAGYEEKLASSKRCWRGSSCKPVEYKVRVLTYRTAQPNPAGSLQKDHTTSLLPDSLRSEWKFKTVTVAAGCFCSY